MDRPGIYAFENKITRSVYVGSTTRAFRKRLTDHLNSLRKGKHWNHHFQSAWNLYTEQAFVFTILEVVAEKTNVISKEQYWLEKMGLDRETYNAIQKVHGHWLGKKHSHETVRKLREHVKAFPSRGMLGKHHSLEAAEKMRVARLGKPISEPTKSKLRSVLIKRHEPLRGDYPELINIYTDHIHPAGRGYSRFCRMHKIKESNISCIGKMLSGKRFHFYGWMPLERFNNMTPSDRHRLKHLARGAYNHPSMRRCIETYTYDQSFEAVDD